MNKLTQHVGISVVFFCHDGGGRVLMAKRGQQTRDEQGRWDIGAGRLEFGDTVEATLKREIQEEYGTSVRSFDFLGYRDVMREQEGQPTHWITLDFTVLIDPSQVRNAEPHKLDAVDWFTLDTLPSPVHSQLPTFLKKYHGRLIP